MIDDFLGIGQARSIPSVLTATGGQEVHVAEETGLVFIKERRSAAETARVWSDEVFGDRISETTYTAMNAAMLSRHTFVSAFVDSQIGLREKSVGDFGAGEGQFLRIAGGYGARVMGIEPSAKNCARMRSEGTRCFDGTAEAFSAAAPEMQFDVATMMWTLCNTGDCVSALRAVYGAVRDGGHVVIAESSRILVPFKKPLHTYFNPKIRQDVHPWHFSANTLRTLLELVGFEIVCTNRYFEQDNLVVIGRKVAEPKQRLLKDDPAAVLAFFERWEAESAYYRHFGAAFDSTA